MEERELVIIGGGPAGMSAAVYGRRAGLDLNAYATMELDDLFY